MVGVIPLWSPAVAIPCFTFANALASNQLQILVHGKVRVANRSCRSTIMSLPASCQDAISALCLISGPLSMISALCLISSLSGVSRLIANSIRNVMGSKLTHIQFVLGVHLAVGEISANVVNVVVSLASRNGWRSCWKYSTLYHLANPWCSQLPNRT